MTTNLICPYAASNSCVIYKTWLRKEERGKRIDIIWGGKDYYCIALRDLEGGGFPSQGDVGAYDKNPGCSHITLLNLLEKLQNNLD